MAILEDMAAASDNGTQPDSSALLQELTLITPASLAGDDASRRRALDLCRRLTASLEDPIDAATSIVFTPFVPSAVRTAVDLDVFSILSREGTPVTTEDLSTTSGADALLLQRLLRLLDSIGFVASPGPDQWSSTRITHAMARPEIAAGHRFVWDMLVCANVQSPFYLQQNGQECPSEPADGIFQFAHKTEHNSFEYMAQVRRDRLADFHLFMGNTMGAKTYWVDWYPVTSRLLDGYDTSTALLVDIRAGKGHDLQAFASKYPDLKAELILQDLPDALTTVPKDLDPRIQLQAQDFFTPNQEIGARAYFMHHILHDWSDKYALQILANIVRVMKPGYSKLLIHELILPDTGISPYQARWDMVMMTFGSGSERNRSQWKSLLDQAGLQILEFRHGPDGEDADGIIEAMLK